MSIDIFHDHLDKCSQCANQPLNLCPLGAQVLERAASELPTGRINREPEMQRIRTEPRIKFPEDRQYIAEDLSSLELRILAQAGVFAAQNASAPQTSVDPEDTGLICANCGDETSKDMNGACHVCSLPKVVLRQVLNDLFGPNFRDFIPNKKAP